MTFKTESLSYNFPSITELKLPFSLILLEFSFSFFLSFFWGGGDGHF
jgi:hypothetical protein